MSRTNQGGFTLVELIAVIIILGLLGGVVTLGINKAVGKSRIQATRTQLSVLEQAISLFEMHCGFYPMSLDGLIQAPTGKRCKDYTPGGYLSKPSIPDDSWGNPFTYTNPGIHDPNSYDLWSNGPDQDEGTVDDITSWTSSESEEDFE